MLTGKITSIPRFEKDLKPRFFNFVKYEGNSYFFHARQMNGGLPKWREMIKKIEEKGSVEVKFEFGDDSIPSKLTAKNVTLIE